MKYLPTFEPKVVKTFVNFASVIFPSFYNILPLNFAVLLIFKMLLGSVYYFIANLNELWMYIFRSMTLWLPCV